MERKGTSTMYKKVTHAVLFVALLAFTALCIPLASQAFSLFTAPTYGTGKVQVRLYTSYFCSPCRAVEPYIEPLVQDLVKRNIITLTYVDIPSSKTSVEYASAFLKAVHGKSDVKMAISARKLLISAAESGITERSVLECYLKGKGVALVKTCDPEYTFRVYNQYMKQDRITATPTCVIVDAAGKKTTFHGGQKILDALKKLGTVRVAAE